MLSLRVNFDGAIRSAGGLEAALESLSRPLARIGGKMQSRAKRAFATGGPGWAPLAKATLARKIDRVEVGLLRKDKGGRSGIRSILTEARKLKRAQAAIAAASTPSAQERAQKRARLYAANLEGSREFYSRGRLKFGSVDKLVKYAERETARAKIHGAAMRAAREQTFASDKERRRATHVGARRYRATESATRLLGDLSQTIDMALTKTAVHAFAKSYIGEIHNSGGTAGNGAKIPARPFMVLDDEIIEFAIEVLTEHGIEAWGE